MGELFGSAGFVGFVDQPENLPSLLGRFDAVGHLRVRSRVGVILHGGVRVGEVEGFDVLVGIVVPVVVVGRRVIRIVEREPEIRDRVGVIAFREIRPPEPAVGVPVRISLRFCGCERGFLVFDGGVVILGPERSRSPVMVCDVAVIRAYSDSLPVRFVGRSNPVHSKVFVSEIDVCPLERRVGLEGCQIRFHRFFRTAGVRQDDSFSKRGNGVFRIEFRCRIECGDNGFVIGSYLEERETDLPMGRSRFLEFQRLLAVHERTEVRPGGKRFGTVFVKIIQMFGQRVFAAPRANERVGFGLVIGRAGEIGARVGDRFHENGILQFGNGNPKTLLEVFCRGFLFEDPKGFAVFSPHGQALRVVEYRGRGIRDEVRDLPNERNGRLEAAFALREEERDGQHEYEKQVREVGF